MKMEANSDDDDDATNALSLLKGIAETITNNEAT